MVLRTSGMTYSDIRERMGVPLSTLSAWFKEQKWSNDIATENAKRSRKSAAIKLVVLNTVRGTRLRKIYEEAIQDAFVDFHELRYHPLFITGLMIYRSHGDKTSMGRISLSSMDPVTIKLFKMFLEDICGIKDIRAMLLVMGDQVNLNREGEIKQYWIDKSGLKMDNFIKTVALKPKVSKKITNKPYYGVCTLIVNSAYLKHKILKWCQLLVEDIAAENYLEGEQFDSIKYWLK